MFIFQEIWPALFSCYLLFEVRSFAFLPTMLHFVEAGNNFTNAVEVRKIDQNSLSRA